MSADCSHAEPRRCGEVQPSGIAWFGDVPEGWKVRKLFGSFTENKDKNKSLAYTRAMQFNYGRIVDKKESLDSGEVKEIYSKYSLVRKNDIIINGLNLNYDFVSQRVAISPKEGIITSAYIALRPRQGISPSYYCYLFKSMDSKKMFHGLGTGIRLTLSFKELRNLPLPVPPLPEQEAIVKYLDEATGKIDKAIEAEEKMVALLQERKQIIIHQSVVMRSGWDVKKAKILFVPEKRPVRQDDDIVTCFRDGQVTLRKNRRTEGFTNALKEFGYQGVRRGDLVIHNMDAFAGSIGISDSDGKMSPVCTICTTRRSDVCPAFYAFYLRNLARMGYIKSLARGIRERSTDFRWGDFKELQLPLPTLTEQEAIVKQLDEEMGKIDRAIAVKRRQIELLRERREIIINEVVTGKVKVA